MADTEDEKYHGEAVPAQSEDFTRISDEVVSTIAGIELNKIEGVHPVGGGITDFLGRKNPSKGIKIEADGDQIALEVAVTVDYGVSIPDVAHEVQARLRKAISEMTGKFISSVNVSVQGIRTGVEKRENVEDNESHDDNREE
jgi:uncharacterized alkaline shock family protein YloU